LGGRNCGLTFYVGGGEALAIFKRELVDLITFGLNKKKVRGERKFTSSNSFDLIDLYAQINGMLTFFFAIFVLHVLQFNL